MNSQPSQKCLKTLPQQNPQQASLNHLSPIAPVYHTIFKYWLQESVLSSDSFLTPWIDDCQSRKPQLFPWILWTYLPYSFLPDSINNLFPNKHPSIHPRLLWIISSNSNNPLQSQSWLISIADDTVIPTSNPIHHFSFLPVTPGNKIPAGKSSRIFNRFSCNKLPSAVLPNLPHLPIPSISFHDQNTSNWYCLIPGVLVKTVEPNTIARNVRSSSPQTACMTTILCCFNNTAARNAAIRKTTAKAIISLIVQLLLCVTIIW